LFDTLSLHDALPISLARALAGLGTLDPQLLLVLASLCWGGAFCLLLVLITRVRARPRRPENPGL
jgi:hypothetical protein